MNELVRGIKISDVSEKSFQKKFVNYVSKKKMTSHGGKKS